MISSNSSKTNLTKRKYGFSLVELSIVLLIIGIIIVGVSSGSVLIQAAKISGARQLSLSTPVVQKTPDLGLWLETTRKDSFDTATKVDGNDITVWNDLSLTNTQTYQATTPGGAGTIPIFDIDDINGLPGVKFDGTNDYMQILNFKADSYMTLFVVGKFELGTAVPAASEAMFIEHGTSVGSSDGFLFYGQGTNPVHVKRAATDSSSVPNANWFGTSPAIGIMRYDGTNLSYKRHDDTAFTDSADPDVLNTLLTDTLNIGARAGSTDYTSNGSFGEIIHYNRALDDDEIDGIMEYLQVKWDIY